MHGHDSDRDNGTFGIAISDATTTEPLGKGADPMADRDEVIFDLLELWEDGYRKGADPTPETLGVNDPVILERLRELIRNQRRLYEGLGIAGTPKERVAETDEPHPTFPGYEIIAQIGRGGMGIVYKALDQKLRRIVAIKTISDGRHATSDQLDRFQAEAQAVARLRHPNIIAIHAIGEHDKRPYLSLEFAEGGSLSQRLAKKPMASREAAALVETLARAVHAAHQAGVVHRDLKPSNVLLTADGIPKVSDFGLAKLLDSDSGRTLSGQVMGSPSYMAPEQAEGHSKQVGPPADIYALGAMLYQALTGRPPFLGESAMETLKLVTSTEVVAPHLLRPDIPRDLETICLKCLDKDPKHRYATAAELAEDLRRFLEGRPTLARPPSAAERSVRWCRRNPWIAASVAALLLGSTISTWQAVRATIAERSAKLAEAATRKEWERAETEVEIKKAVNEFLNKDMLAQASAYSQASLNWKPDPDLKVRTALDRAAERIGERFADRPLVEAAIRLTIGEAYEELGLYREAQPHLERALELRRRLLGNADLETLNAMISLGTLFQADAKTAEAARLLLPALDGLRRAKGEDHPDTLMAMSIVGALYVDQDKRDDAEAILSRAIDGLSAVRGAEHVNTLLAMNNLANVYLTGKKPEQAERLLERALKSLKDKVGGKHPASLIAMNNLAIAYNATGKRQQAEELWNDALRTQRQMLGDNHPDTLTTKVTLGEFYLLQNKYDEAEKLLLEALNGCRAALDRNHLATDASLALLSSLYVNKRELKKAEQYLIEAMEVTRARYGPDHALAVWATELVGSILITQKEFARAEPYLRDCLATRIKTDPEGSGRITAEGWLGLCLLGLKKYAEAEPLLLSSYERDNARKDDRPGASPSTLNLLDRIINLYDAWGKKDKSEEWRTKRVDRIFLNDPFAPEAPSATLPAGG